MLKRLKGMINADEKIDELSSKAKQNTKSLKEQSNSISELGKEIDSMKQELSKHNSAAEKHTKLMMEQAEEFSRLQNSISDELYELKMLKKTFQTKLVEELMTSFKEELGKQTSKLDTDVKNYNELKQKLASVTDDVSTVSGEVEKFIKISSQIKEADFEMARYAREVSKMDHEKLNLMKQLDSLQKVVAAERRRGRR